MNNIPLLKAKLVVPEIPRKVLLSERIKNLKVTAYRAVIITAPAGFGKTTAVLLSLHKLRDDVLWYRMEKEDSFLPAFYTYLIEIFFGQEGKVVADAIRSLLSIGKISEEYPLLNAVICQNAWTRFPDKANLKYLVLDDFENVVDNTAIVETIKYFISNLPPNMRIIVMSRVDTGIPTGKLTLNEDILLLDHKSLCFSKEEVEKLTSDIYKVTINSNDINTMHDYSEGWIAGITLLLHAVGLNPSNLGEMIKHGNMQNIFRYLLSEVFDGIDKSRMKTLASISILSDFTCDDLKAVFFMKDAEKTISWLEKNNIFIQKTKTETFSYRLHSLIRSVLLSTLNELFSPSEIKEMNLSAAAHYKSRGDFSTAIKFLIDAGKVYEAIGIASVEGVKFMDAGDTDRVISIIKAFPEEMINSNQYLLFLQGASLMSTELDQSYSILNTALILFLQSGELSLQMKTAGLMISICSQRNDHQHIAGIISLLPKFKMLAVSKYARITLLMSAFMKFGFSDDLGMAKVLYKIIDRLGFYEPLWDYTYKLTKGMIFYRLGDLKAAKVLMNQVLNHPTALVNDRWRAIGLAMCHCITSFMRDVDASEKLVEELSSIGEKYDSDYARSYAHRLAAYNKYQIRNIIDAVSEMEEAESAFTRYDNPIMVCVTRMTKYLWKSEIEEVEPLVLKASAELNFLETLKPGMGFMELCQANMGAIFKEAGRYTEAEDLFVKAYNTSKRKKANQSMCGTAMHLADLYYRKEEFKHEERYLKIWGNTVANQGYEYFREMNYPTLVRVCARCIEKNIRSDYMLKIIDKYFVSANVDGLEEAPDAAAADPKAFILSCSLLLKKTKTIRIKLFGCFRLVVDDLEIGENEWKTRKICGILKYIMANPEKTVSREALTAAFWPESDSKAASTSLRVALFELRKILARFGMAFESEEALIAESKGGFYICSKNTIETDTERFVGLYKKYKSGNLSPTDTKDLFIQMVELYDGDFLQDDSYDEWVVLSREHYKSIFIEVSHRLAGIYIAGGESEHAEVLMLKHMKVDPYDEKACSTLINLYNGYGRKNQAASLRRQFEKRFEAEMGIKPDL